VASRIQANPEAKKEQAMRTDVYERVTNRVVLELEKGVRPWLTPWNSGQADGDLVRRSIAISDVYASSLREKLNCSQEQK